MADGGHDSGFAREICEEKKVSQPLRASLSLRNTWLLPRGIGIMTEYFEAGFDESKGRAGQAEACRCC